MIERIILRKVKSSEELALDMVSTPNFILKSVDWGTIKGTHHSYKYVNQIGATVTNTSLDVRRITIEGWVVAQSEADMIVYKQKLNSFVNPQEAIDLFYSDYVIRFYPDESVKYSIAYAENNDMFAKFQIVGTAPNPLFADVSERQVTFATTAPVFHFPLIIAEDSIDKGVIFGRRTEGLIINVLNRGSVSVGMKIVFKAKGAVVNPKLINVNTQEELVIAKSLVAGEEVVVNTNIGEKSVKGRVSGASYVNYYMHKRIDSSWLQLEVGSNLFRYDADSGVDNLDIFVYFTNKFLEVQECY